MRGACGAAARALEQRDVINAELGEALNPGWRAAARVAAGWRVRGAGRGV